MRALRIPVTGPVQEVDWNVDQIDSWPGLVDAETIDMFSIRVAGIQGMVGEWSLLNGSETNVRASWLLLGFGRAMRTAGPVVIMGLDTETGEAHDIHPNFVEAALQLSETPGA